MPGASPPHASEVSRASLVAAALLSAAVAFVVCGRSLGGGLYLYRDFVTVPHPVLNAAALGASGQAPRSVPLDAVMAVLAGVVPTGLQQQCMLVASVFLAGLGTAVLLRLHGLAAMAAGAACAMWNPFVAERLLVGQPPTLLAYSMTPWLVLAVRSRLSAWRSVLAVAIVALPAALTPWGSLVAAVVVVGAALATPSRRRPGVLTAYLLVVIGWCLPWAVPAVAHASGGADPDGARAFALLSDSPLGTLGSALTLGGIWSSAAHPASRDTTLAVVASLVLLCVGVVGVVVMVRAGSLGAALLLSAAWGLPPVVAWAVSGGPGLSVFAALQQVPGVAIARDTHRWLGFSALAAALLIGAAVGGLARTVPRLPRSAAVVSASVAVVTMSIAVLAAPDLPRGVAAAYQPVAMSADWEPAVRAASVAGQGGTVLSIPWQPFRRTPWAGASPFLDPLSRAVDLPVLASHQLTVARDRSLLVVDDDPADVAQFRVRLDPATLREHDVRAIVVWRRTPGNVPPMPATMHRVFQGADLEVWALTRPN